MENVQQKIYAHIIEKLGMDEEYVQYNAPFTDGLGNVSLDFFELFAYIERGFDSKMPEDEAEKLRTVGALKILWQQ